MPLNNLQTAEQITVATADDQPVFRRLGVRLEHLYRWALAAGHFDEVWDLCCDHGRLGLHLHRALFEQEPACESRVHLVDRVPKIVHELESRYQSLISPRLTVRCLDAGDITLPNRGRQLILLAGIGGGTMVNMLTKLFQQIAALTVQTGDAQFDFMLSPNLHMFELRRFLRQQHVELVKEEFVTEKGRSHEHLHLRYCSGVSDSRRVDPVGSEIWLPLSDEKERYLRKLLEHYKTSFQATGSVDAGDAIAEYSEVLGQARRPGYRKIGSAAAPTP